MLPNDFLAVRSCPIQTLEAVNSRWILAVCLRKVDEILGLFLSRKVDLKFVRSLKVTLVQGHESALIKSQVAFLEHIYIKNIQKLHSELTSA